MVGSKCVMQRHEQINRKTVPVPKTGTDTENRFCYFTLANKNPQISSQAHRWCSAKFDGFFILLAFHYHFLIKSAPRLLLGEDILTLGMKELKQLERQLRIGVDRLRSKKWRLLSEQVGVLKRNHKTLQEENSFLQKKGDADTIMMFI
ncbi:uncharacterized protein [Rutidosis leptorrhynchoides]|uniref:uncharacterized protein n=1 Tax=Rutidosis leptorrhynchoides TaxID=125765 RepID=UPI003A99EFB8